MKGLISGSAKVAGVGSGEVAGEIASKAVWIFGIIAALQELQVAQEFLGIILQGIVVAISIAVGLAFGFGGQQAAGEYVDKMKNRLK